MTSDESGLPPVEGAEGSGEAALEKGPFLGEWDRRTLFKSAALGTAAAAMYTGGRMAFGPLTAYADNLSALNCTANDVRIVGPGIILNEPCVCQTTFNAQVQFRVINNTGTTRYCVTVHFCPGALPGGGTFDPGDILIGDIPPKSDANYTVTIPNYPCGSGLVCFGAAGPEADGGFPKGAACPAGECCTTISWDVNTGCPSRVISSKCRHQQVCIQGRGATTIACPNNDCAVPCGGSTTLTVCTSEPTSEGPFIFELYTSDDVLVARFPTSGTTTDKCHAFTVSPTANTTYYGRVISTQDTPDCVKDSGEVTVTVTTITVTLDVAGEESCGSGNLTFTASTGNTGCTYEFKVDGTTVQNTTSNTYSYSADPDSTCHRVTVKATCSGCESNEAGINVSQCVTTTTGCTLPTT
jgi:hypothetical protein